MDSENRESWPAEYIEYTGANGARIIEDGPGGEYIDNGYGLIPLAHAKEMGLVRHWVWTSTGYVQRG